MTRRTARGAQGCLAKIGWVCYVDIVGKSKEWRDSFVRICMLTSSYPRHADDGAGSFVRYLAKHLGRLGHEVHVVAPHDGGNPCPPHDERVAVTFFKYAPSSELRVFGYGRSLRSDVRLRPAVYLALGPFVTSALAAVLRTTTVHRCELIHAHWAVPSGFVGAVMSLALRLPLVVSLHGSDMYLSTTSHVARLGAGMAFRWANAVTACSQDLLDKAIRLGASPATSWVIPYGVEVDAFTRSLDGIERTRQRLGVRKGELVVSAVGRLVTKKGFDYLLRAIPLIERQVQQPLRVILGGDGDLRQDLERLAAEQGVADRVVFTGPLAQSGVADVLAASDVVAVPSIRDDWGNVDGLPVVLLEAMAAGRAVVATRVGGIPMAVRDGENGILVAERSSEELAQAIVRLLESPELRRSLGGSARTSVETHFTWAALAQAYDRVYSVCRVRGARVLG